MFDRYLSSVRSWTGIKPATATQQKLQCNTLFFVHHTFCQPIHSRTKCLRPAIIRILVQGPCTRGLAYSLANALKYIRSVSLPSEAITTRRASRKASPRSKLFLLLISPMNIRQFTKEWDCSIAAIQITSPHILPWLIFTK